MGRLHSKNLMYVAQLTSSRCVVADLSLKAEPSRQLAKKNTNLSRSASTASQGQPIRESNLPASRVKIFRFPRMHHSSSQFVKLILVHMVHKISEPDATRFSLGNIFFSLFISVYIRHPLIKVYESLWLARLTGVLYFRFSLAPTFASYYHFFYCTTLERTQQA